jgi:hypothetical protein
VPSTTLTDTWLHTIQHPSIEVRIGEILESRDSVDHRQETASIGDSEMPVSNLCNDPCVS